MDFLAALDPLTLLALVTALAVTGIAAGMIGGLLGVGGGIVMVPILYEALRLYGVAEAVAMHAAVGTSLAVIVFNSIRSTMAQRRRNAVDMILLRRFGPAVFAGAVAGAAIAAVLSGAGLRALFGIVCVAFAFYMAFAPLRWTAADAIPNHPVSHAAAALLGGLSALMGIGGGTFGVTAMTVFGVPIHRAVGTGAGLGVLIGLPAAIGFVLIGLGREGLPPLSLGYVNLGALVVLAPAAIVSAPWGVALSHRLPPRGLRVAFGLFLGAAGVRMLLS